MIVEPVAILPHSFLRSAIDLPERADFIATGDFNSDGYADIAVAARGSGNVFLFAGSGKGSFGEGQRIELGGQVTAMLGDNSTNEMAPPVSPSALLERMDLGYWYTTMV